MDSLSVLLHQYAPRARLFYAGSLCGRVDYQGSDPGGHLHLLRAGTLRLSSDGEASVTLDEPTLILFPASCGHRMQSRLDCDLVCANVRFGRTHSNPLVAALPSRLIIPLASAPGLAPVLELLFQEAAQPGYGQSQAMDRLLDLLLILVLRHVLDAGLYRGGVLAGLADPRLGKAIIAMQQQPEHPWTLQGLAALAGMSRARFAAHFHQLIGKTPLLYLTEWRLTLAQQHLLAGEPLKLIAPTVGYGSSAALTRAFAKACGLTPGQWLRQQQTVAEPPLD
ncbi:AraC family transcriptional regulator [Aeromonas rivuli]|uniref:AraC family transcriptional regulator n=1 Tax=Aeromonas rivuli TaxID=648794 RepID=UPI001CCD1FDF|nr:AraC family transcriptional regulator [Aeromonas rivuli]UBO73639.1 AraC family transcriptional regulator [Aeromonas rivuli]